MGLLGMAIAGGIAQGTQSFSDSIEQQEKMQYAEMLQNARQKHEEYLVGLRHKLDMESRDSGMVDANGRPLMRSEYDALEDKAGTQNAHSYQQRTQQDIKDSGENAYIGKDGTYYTQKEVDDGIAPPDAKPIGMLDLEKHNAEMKDKTAAAEEKTKRGEYYENGGGSRGSGQLAMKIQAIKDQGYPPEQEAELIQDAIHKETQFKPPVEKKPTYNKAAADEVVSLKGEIEAAHKAGDTEKAKELQDSLNSTLGEYGKPLQRFVPDKKESEPGMINKATGGRINTTNEKVTPGYWVTEKPEGGLIDKGKPNNNAGNIRKDSSSFKQYDDPDSGVKAVDDQLRIYGEKHGVKTLAQTISRWSPKSDNNDTDALIANASKVTGFKPNQEIDLKNPAVRALVSAAIIKQEGSGLLKSGVGGMLDNIGPSSANAGQQPAPKKQAVKTAPAAALELLNKDPEQYSEQFFAKYGYLPEGF